MAEIHFNEDKTQGKCLPAEIVPSYLKRQISQHILAEKQGMAAAAAPQTLMKNECKCFRGLFTFSSPRVTLYVCLKE